MVLQKCIPISLMLGVEIINYLVAWRISRKTGFSFNYKVPFKVAIIISPHTCADFFQIFANIPFLFPDDRRAGPREPHGAGLQHHLWQPGRSGGERLY